jgi:hypothetical protein
MRVRGMSVDWAGERRQSFACVAPDAPISHSSSRVRLRVRPPNIRTGPNMELQHSWVNDWHSSERAVITTSAAEQSAGAAYSQGRRRELQLPAVLHAQERIGQVGKSCEEMTYAN